MFRQDGVPIDAPPELRVRALESLLVEKGVIDPKTIDAIVDIFQTKVGPRNGAKVVAHAWTDSDYKKRLLTNGTAALKELGFLGLQGENIVAVENTEKVHNVVCCTLCSCYPWPLLGLPPIWYKSAPYRSRVVIDPRGVLKEFGTIVPDDITIRVWDSTAEIRYLVVPQRPKASEGMSEQQLAGIVTRDSMVGVARTIKV